jgi:neutral ceramidase
MGELTPTAREMMSQSIDLQAAVIPIEITPPIGVRMEGYGARKDPSNDVHDPLYATLLVLKSGNSGVAIVSFDLLAVALTFTSRLRAALSPIIGIPQQGIFVAATHTHSGPAGFLGRIPLLSGDEDPLLQEVALRRVTGAGIWASQHLQPAQLAIGVGHVQGIGLNRNDPVNGLADDEVTILRVDGADGQPLAVLMNYGCHPTVLGPSNLAFSADYPGAARAELKKIYPRTAFLFTNGATGDVSTRFTRRGQGFDEVERVGRILAGEVLKQLQLVTPAQEADLSGQVSPIKLALRPLPPLEIAQQQLDQLQAELEDARRADRPPGEIRKAITKVEGAQIQLTRVQSEAHAAFVETQIQLIKIGPLALLAIPGEPFASTVLAIKAKSPIRPTAVVSYGNDYRGYFPDAAAIDAGTYEALTSPFDETAADQLAQTCLALALN